MLQGQVLEQVTEASSSEISGTRRPHLEQRRPLVTSIHASVVLVTEIDRKPHN